MKDNNVERHPLKFDVHPSVVYRLGDELITDIDQALLELIKNSYDADASYAKVTITCPDPNHDIDSHFQGAIGTVCIEDDGVGMDLKTIIDGWLLVSNSAKRKFKALEKETAKKRTPLGDKGLGRLGAQRLGYNLELITKTEEDTEQSRVSFSWNDFLKHQRLSDVPIYFDQLPSSKKCGTKILISNLRDLSQWQGNNNIGRLEKSLSSLVSPYNKIDGFNLYVFLNGRKLELTEFSTKLRQLSAAQYKFSFDKKIFNIMGCAGLDFFRPTDGVREKLNDFSVLVSNDNGDALWTYLSQLPNAKRFGLQRALNGKSFVSFSASYEFEGLDNLQEIDDQIANPGPFHGEIDVFDLSASAYNHFQLSVFDSLSEYRNRVKELSGIRVYRNGFKIRMDPDWLGLGARWSTGLSYYGLKPDTTLGYLEISAKENRLLEETTDREGFKNTPYYKNFYRILRQLESFAGEAQEFLRRGYNDFVKKNNEIRAKIDKPVEPEDLAQIIKTNVSKANKHKASLVKVIEEQNHLTKTAPLFAPQKPLVSEDSLNETIKFLESVSNLEPLSQVLNDRIESLKEQIKEMYETIGLGLTAEALSHEIFNITDNLSKKTSTIKSYFQQKEIKDIRLISFAESVNTSTNALRKQVAHLSPSLKYVREKKESLLLSTFLTQSIQEFYKTRLAKKHISMEIKSETDFRIYMNAGKLTQILDNLILNSEYWLNEDIQHHRIRTGVITFQIKQPYLYILDNGRGIEPAIETAVFEPFVTHKGKEDGQKRGRGLGLFIIQQLLDSEGCYITLLPNRNNNNRLFTFQIDLHGVLDER